MDLKAVFAQRLEAVLDGKVDYHEIYPLIEVPKNKDFGDLAFPCFQLAKLDKKPPAQIAEELATQLSSPILSEIHAMGPYVNVSFCSKTIGKDILTAILQAGESYGESDGGIGKTVVLDMSSPNIARPFSMGHLRSTVIGHSLSKIAAKCGYKTVKINHLGDWGTQFGKLIVAYKKWGDKEKVELHPIEELRTLYVKFHEEAEKKPELNEEARAAFKELEQGSEEYLTLWNWFRKESLKAFHEIYDLLGVNFDSYNGEAFFNDKMEKIVCLLGDRGLLEKSEGALVVPLEEGLPPCLIRKTDGATLYATRDLAAALYRKQEYNFDEMLYVVGQEQTVHFKQITGVLDKLQFKWAHSIKHIPFGLYLKDGKRMSTRKGKVVLLGEVLKEAVDLALANILEKNPDLPDSMEVAKDVGVGAVVFHDLKSDRLNSIEFSLKDMLTFEGETGPYIQYTHARAHSILRKRKEKEYRFSGLDDKESWEIIKLLNEFPAVIARSYSAYSPSLLAKYLIELSKSFNKYYGKVRIIEEDEDLLSRLSLVKAVADILAEGLQLLGIGAPKEM
ncbi:arginine--tRNA ligase [Heyndrickxia acidicola]|uniref:Arginine--tRNA ligase n=1 Tax=Heyndrickxia acidicola TaxID=209389 RepID=A0ABU6MEN3_9BACI|nr:arginine--tRNA ligase [Heyndrickxia acidicola]MED1202955.1 arginine--tRNA ligase [Heyndrickxia acidicola]